MFFCQSNFLLKSNAEIPFPDARRLPSEECFSFRVCVCSSGELLRPHRERPAERHNFNRALCFRNLDRERERAVAKFGLTRRVQFGN